MKNRNLIQGLGLLGLATLLLPACGPSAKKATAGLPGTIGDNADGTHFVIESNESGESSTMQIMSVSFGRLVDEVYDASGTTPVHRDLVIGQDIESDGTDYLIETNPISRVTRLTILHDFGTTAYDTAFAKLFLGMDDLLTKDLSASTLPPYSMVPRNSAIVVRLSDLVDASSISQDTVRLLSGYGPTSPFTTRMFADPNFGATVDGVFHSTRLILDPVVTAAESTATGLPVNSLGFNASINTSMPNLALRIPTVPDIASGQFTLLSNLVGNPLIGAGNAPFDYDSSTLDAVRAFRSGGLTEKVGDPNNGFLPDGSSPEVIGRQSVTVTNVSPDLGGGPSDYLVDMTFANINCADAPKVGDILEQPGVFAEVTLDGGAPVLGVVTGVKMKLLTTGSGVPFPGGGHYETPYDPNSVVGADCFVEFDPPAGAGTNLDVDPYANVIVRFSEPMDPALMTPFDSFVISRTNDPLADLSVGAFVVGEVAPSSDLTEFRFVQTAPFRHTFGLATDDFFINLFGEEGVVDLAGNGLDNALPQVQFFIDPAAETHKTNHKSFRFATYTDVPNIGNVVDDFTNGSADIRGQFVADTVRGTISPRPVDRFSQTIDRNQAVPNWMVANASTLTGGLLGTVQEPLNPLGCKLMNLWRYFDMGLDSADEAFFNIDVEHVNWAPIGSNVIAEYYPDFQISMTTTSRFPDESWIGPPNTLIFPTSGLIATAFTENILLDPHNEVKIVHDRTDGYFVDPVDKFKSTSQTFMFPFPMNRDVPADEFKYWTFRDTAITTRGGSDAGIGIEPPVRFDAVAPGGIISSFGSGEFTYDDTATPPVTENQIVPDGSFMPSFGLPILTEYRCYSSDDAIGVNRLDTSLAMAPAWTVGVTPANALASLPKQPFMRLFSAGGYDASDQKIYRDPDLEVAPNGGFNYETAVAPKGTPTAGADNVYYMGQLDFVIRVSRVYTHWHKVNDANPVYFEPVIEPRNDQQPEGTSVNLDFRGAQNLTANPPQGDALTLNAYGDIPGSNDTGVFGDPASDNGSLSNLTDWTSNITDLNGLVFYQVRITFINNAAAGTFPELSTLALAQESL